MARRKRRRRSSLGDAVSANQALRAATVHFEEAEFHSKNGNCAEAARRLSMGAYELGVGRGMQGPSPDISDGLNQIRKQVTLEFAHRCVRRG